MGGKLSSIFSNIFMEIFERYIAMPTISKCILWRRYVDDIFSVWRNIVDLKVILEELNDYVPSILFTLEEEHNAELPFLDLVVIKSPNGFLFRIYRKDSNNGLIINHNSGHTYNIKQMSLISFFLRAFNLVSPQFLEAEFENITDIGLKNGYDLPFILSCKRRAMSIFYKTTRTPLDLSGESVVLPYHPNLENLVAPLKMLKIRLIFKFNSTLGDFLLKNSPPIDSGIVYRIPCGCGMYYVGQTSIKLTERIKQHKRAVLTSDLSSACNNHYGKCNEDIQWDLASVLFKQNNYSLRNMLESATIQLSYDNNFNSSLGINVFDTLSLHLVNKYYNVLEALS